LTNRGGIPKSNDINVDNEELRADHYKSDGGGGGGAKKWRRGNRKKKIRAETFNGENYKLK
jgi:hypothetical protein